MLLDKFVGSHLSDILLNEEMKVSAWDKLNDPFEGLHKLESYSPQQAKNFIARWNQAKINKGFPPLDTVGYDVNNDIDAMNFIVHNSELLTRQGRETLNKLYRIACFTKHQDQKSPLAAKREILMWAHYGNSQKGARIVFDVSFKSIPGHTRDVEYQQQLPELPLDVLHAIPKITNTELIAPIYTKSEAWVHESECRLIVELEDVKSRYNNETPFEYVPFPIESVKMVDFGLHYLKEKRNDLIEKLREGKGSHINFRQCDLKPNRFEFTFDTIN